MLQVVLPFSFVHTLIIEVKCAVSLSLVIGEVAFVSFDLAIVEVSSFCLTFTCIIRPLTIMIDTLIRPHVFTLAMFHIILPVTLIGESTFVCLPRHFTFTMSFVILPVTYILAAITVFESTATVLFSFRPLTIII